MGRGSGTWTGGYRQTSVVIDIKHPPSPNLSQPTLSPGFKKSNLGLISSNMGVEIKRLSPGDGKTFPKKGDKVSIHYVGTLANGDKFDSSRDRRTPFETTIGVGKVIKGWDEGVPQLSVGEKAILVVSPDYGYGPNGYPPIIPPNSILNFEVELLKIF